MKTENLSTLKIHQLSQEQFEREKASGNINQTALYLTPDEFVEDDEYPGCYYRMVDGEKEWFNPPMVGATEYRTAERYSQYPVYTMQVRLHRMNDVPFTEEPQWMRYETSIPRASAKIINTAVVYKGHQLPWFNADTGAARMWFDINTDEDIVENHNIVIIVKYQHKDYDEPMYMEFYDQFECTLKYVYV